MVQEQAETEVDYRRLNLLQAQTISISNLFRGDIADKKAITCSISASTVLFQTREVIHQSLQVVSIIEVFRDSM